MGGFGGIGRGRGGGQQMTLADGGASTEKLAIMGALWLYLDFINLFVSLLRIFGNANADARGADRPASKAAAR